MARFWNLVTGNGTSDEPGDTAGLPLRGMRQEMNTCSMTVDMVLADLGKLHVKGTKAQFSRATTGKQALTLVAELRLLEIFGFETPMDLVNPQYPDDLQEKIKETYRRNLES